MLVNFYGKLYSLETMRQLSGMPSQGASVKDIMAAAERLQLRGRALRLELSDICHLTLPAVLHWDMDHFVVVKTISRKYVTIHDPAVGIKRYLKAELDRHFTGVALEFQPTTEFLKEEEPECSVRMSLSELVAGMPGIITSLVPVLFLSILIQILALLTPLYLQLVIDQGIIKGDLSLVFMLALMFGVLMIIRVLISYLRGLMLLATSNQLGYSLVGETFHHLLRLPLSFFERRELGDIVSRFSALDRIKQLMTSDMITAVVDGIFSLLTLVLLFLYQPMLAMITVSAVVMHSLLRISTLSAERRRRQEAVEMEARHQTRFMEDVRSIASIKINGMEAERESDWLQRYSQFINCGFGLGRLQLRLSSGEAAILGVENLLIIFFASELVVSGGLSLGQMMSFVFLKQHFLGSVLAMIPKLGELRLMRLELERIADIRHAQPEPGFRKSALFNPVVQGHISISNLSFGYPGDRGFILQNLDIDIPAGEITVLTGPSGSGKSTLLKLILGLESVQHGSLLVDGWDHSQRCPRRFREQVAALLHDESLLAGTLAFNINLGVDPGNRQRLEKASTDAGIAALVASLPMGYATRVGELGNQFSAGQLRRILIARALYRQPRLLILDETLSHLGQCAALEIIARLRCLAITVIIVSHDSSIIAAADRRIQLSQIERG